ncbi:hypothetical protein GMST_05040 [Geomonas silvestris]|uniref:Uncharacterized protein n=2 Tax=Geomonas silvestris TaxID=2740184 RepID=A0A6V8MET5_9BACT|nr:hypothetical protein GMST_05040 [Geomonas silvestris]
MFLSDLEDLSNAFKQVELHLKETSECPQGEMVNWKDLVGVLQRQVPSGSVTTYSEVSMWAYGVPNRNQPVRSLLVGARNHGYKMLTNRVVGADGKFAELPDGTDQQRNQLLNEGISFDEKGRVDLAVSPPVILTNRFVT